MAAALSISGSGTCRGAHGSALPSTGRVPRGPLPAARRCCTNAARLAASRGGAASPRVPPRDGASGVLSGGAVRCCAALGSGVSSSSGTEDGEREVYPGVFEGFWVWRGHRIRYHRSGDKGEAVLLVHGFGGNADHWRKNTPVLGANGFRAYAIDLLGYGYSDKPDPKTAAPNSIYCFPVWGEQLADFIDEFIGSPATISCNSVGGLAGLEAAILRPKSVRGVQLLDISLRGLHAKRQNSFTRPFVTALQWLLRETSVGAAFFGNIARPETVRNVLTQAYGVKTAVTDELIDVILSPGLRPGAVSVFLDFISYSGGPLPEELLASCPVPVSMLWGEEDPWESIELGRGLLSGAACVAEFVPLPGIGHCPQDEAPGVVNPLIERFVRACAVGIPVAAASDTVGVAAAVVAPAAASGGGGATPAP